MSCNKCQLQLELIPSPPAGTAFTKALFGPDAERRGGSLLRVLVVILAVGCMVAGNVLPLNQPSEGMKANASYFWWQQVFAWWTIFLFFCPQIAEYYNVTLSVSETLVDAFVSTVLACVVNYLLAFAVFPIPFGSLVVPSIAVPTACAIVAVRRVRAAGKLPTSLMGVAMPVVAITCNVVGASAIYFTITGVMISNPIPSVQGAVSACYSLAFLAVSRMNLLLWSRLPVEHAAMLMSYLEANFHFTYLHFFFPFSSTPLSLTLLFLGELLIDAQQLRGLYREISRERAAVTAALPALLGRARATAKPAQVAPAAAAMSVVPGENGSSHHSNGSGNGSNGHGNAHPQVLVPVSDDAGSASLEQPPQPLPSPALVGRLINAALSDVAKLSSTVAFVILFSLIVEINRTTFYVWEKVVPRSLQFTNTLIIAAVYFAARLLLTALKLLILQRFPGVLQLQRAALVRWLSQGVNAWILLWMSCAVPLIITSCFLTKGDGNDFTLKFAWV